LDRSGVRSEIGQTLRKSMLAIAALLVATGCGDGGDASSSEAKGKIPRTLEVGSEIPYAPFEFGRPPYRGFDVDVVNEIANRLGSHARFVNTPFNTIFRDLAQRRFDMVAAGAVILPDKASFSEPYLPADLAVMVKRGSDIESPDDLKEKTVGAQRGSAGAAYARNETGARFVRTYALVDDAYAALAAGQVDAVIHEYPVTRFAQRSRRDLAVVATIGTDEDYGFAFPEGSPLEARVDRVLEQIKRDGTYARIYRKWFRAPPPEGFAKSTANGN
jgi:ABC-type amino acid transport substrate-binding protein